MDTIEHLKRFLTEFAANLKEMKDENPLEGYFISRKEEGTIHLSNTEQADLRALIELLHSKHTQKYELSRHAIENALQDAMFAIVAAKRSGEVPLDEAVSGAFQYVRDVLATEPQAYRVWVPIKGLKHAELPSSFAGVEFSLLDEDLEQRVVQLRNLNLRPESEPGIETLGPEFELIRASDGWNREVAELMVTAQDAEAATELAKWRVRQEVYSEVVF